MLVAAPALAGALCVAFCVHWARHTPLGSVGWSRTAVVSDGEHWRVLAGCTAHRDWVHALVTCALLLVSCDVEAVFGPFVYICQSCILLVRWGGGGAHGEGGGGA